jgi:hypothetical protein
MSVDYCSGRKGLGGDEEVNDLYPLHFSEQTMLEGEMGITSLLDGLACQQRQSFPVFPASHRYNILR